MRSDNTGGPQLIHAVCLGECDQTIVVRCGYPLDALVGEVSGGGDTDGA